MGTAFANLRLSAEALPPTEEGVAILRELPAVYRGRTDLAAALTRLSRRFSELGDADKALSAIEEAKAIREELAAAHPERSRADMLALTRLYIRMLEN